MVEWLPIPGWPYYEASSSGEIRSLDRVLLTSGENPFYRMHKGHVLSPSIDSAGYYSVSLHGRRRTFTVHSLVCLAFFGPRPAGKAIDHIDGNKLNNSIHNLRYTSFSVNNLNKRAAGCSRRKCGSWHSRIQVNGKDINIGTFKTQDEAHAAYESFKQSILMKAK